MADSERKELVGVEDVAVYLDVKPSWIYDRTRSGHPDPLPCYRMGGYLRFRLSEIDHWLESHRKQGAATGAA